jgi:hypothetical protein
VQNRVRTLKTFEYKLILQNQKPIRGIDQYQSCL